MRRPVPTVLMEAITIGLMSLFLYFILLKLKVSLFVGAFLVGVLLHLIFEYWPLGNLNKWWCKKTF